MQVTNGADVMATGNSQSFYVQLPEKQDGCGEIGSDVLVEEVATRRQTSLHVANGEQQVKRQADRAARNRESSRRAREKAKTRFRNLELDNYNLRETVRNLRMQNDYLHAQLEHNSAVQQSCQNCRCKTTALQASLHHQQPPPRSTVPNTSARS